MTNHNTPAMTATLPSTQLANNCQLGPPPGTTTLVTQSRHFSAETAAAPASIILLQEASHCAAQMKRLVTFKNGSLSVLTEFFQDHFH